MDSLRQCAENFARLTEYEYYIIAGRSSKGVKESIEFVVSFRKSDFFHLAGLHKLTDLPQVRHVRSNAISNIIDGRLTEAQLCKSVRFCDIRDRLKAVASIERFMDSNELIFRYDKHNVSNTTIEADYLMQNVIDSCVTYLFLAKRREDDTQVCKSIFRKKNKDYTKGQQKFKLLYKEKISTKTGEKVIQYDRLSPKS